jgi:DNA-binding NarL/FixJ family response regulator
MTAGRIPSDFIGRDTELERAGQTLLAAHPAGQVVAIAGDPGIGKSRFTAELCSRAGGSGALVLNGRASEFERDLPFALVEQALDPYVATLGSRPASALGAETVGELAYILPSLAQTWGRPDGALQDERYRAYRALRSLLEWLATKHRVLLALDDVQWADPASTELVTHLLARGPGAGVGLVLAYRSGQAPGTVVRAVEQAVRDRRGTAVELQPFTAAEAAEWFGGRVDAAARDELRMLSGGNPFFLEQLLVAREHATPAPAASDQDGAGTIPAAVLAAIDTELAALDETARLVLRGGAIAGDPFEPDVAGAAAEVAEPEVLAAIDALTERRLVAPTDVPRRFRFRHPILRHAVYASLGGGWRIAAHQRTAEHLRKRGAAPAARAHHVERSAAPGNRDAIALLIAAAEEARSRAPATAARWLAAAERLLPAGDTDQRLELLFGQALSLASAGELERSRVAVGTALELIGPEPTDLRVRLIVIGAAVDHLIGRHATALASLHAAYEALPDATTWAASALQLELAVDRVYASDFDVARAWATQANTLAATLGDGALHAATCGTLAVCDALVRPAPPQSHVDEAAALVDALSDAELATRPEAAYYTAYAENYHERFDASVRRFDRGIAVSRATGQGHVLLPMWIGRALGLERLGRLPEARETLDTVAEIARLGNNVQWLAWGLTLRSWVLAQMGELTTALADGEEGMALARAHDGVLVTVAGGWAFSGALLEAGEPERCRDLILDTAGGAQLPLFAPYLNGPCYELLTRAELALGHLDAAAGWCVHAERTAGAFALGGVAAAAGRARAALTLAEGDAAAAARLAREAAAGFARVQMRAEAARARLLEGRALSLAGRGPEAITVLEHAETELAACGAEGSRREAAGALRTLGRRPVIRADGDGVGGLTARQVQIARLVADGRSNREIAGVLFITEKTVENHLARMFAKLGIASRAALAAAVTRGDASG